MTGPGLPGGDLTKAGAWYTFDSSSGLLETLEIRNDTPTVRAWTGYTHEDVRDVLTVVENNIGALGSPTLLSRYTYLYDDIARRSEVSREGPAFGETHVDVWEYDDRNEITRSRRFATTQPTTTQPAATQPADARYDADRSDDRLSPARPAGGCRISACDSAGCRG